MKPLRTRVKFCGIRHYEDALVAVNLGVDALGLVFYPPSPRAISIAQAQQIAQKIPPFVTLVGLFVNPAADEVEKILNQVPLGNLQFHGDEADVFCASFGVPYFKALGVPADQSSDSVARRLDAYPNAQGILLDTYHPQLYGGTGKRWDWASAWPTTDKPLILAGGLTSDNVADAIKAVQPYGVDVSGGIEIEKGVKSHDKMARFIKAVYQTHAYED